MSITKVDGQTSPVQQQQPVDAPSGQAQVKGATASDITGAPSVAVPASTGLPSPTLTETELRAALDKLQGKSPEIQKAISEAAAAFAANTQLTQAFNAQVYAGLMNDVISAAKNNLGVPFANLYASVQASLEAAKAMAGDNNPALLAICDTAAKIVDLLNEPGGAAKNADKVAVLLAELGTQSAKSSSDADKVVANAQQALDAAKAAYAKDGSEANAAKIKAAEANLADAQKTAGALREAAGLGILLGNVLGLTFEAAKLGEALTEVLNRLSVIIFQKNAPDSLAFSEKVTGAALSGLLMLLAAQVREEAAKRMEQAEKELQAMQELRDRDKELKKLLSDQAKSANETKENTLTASSALVSILASGTDEGWRLLNDILAQRGAGKQSAHPA